jgi:isochorismate synthase
MSMLVDLSPAQWRNIEERLPRLAHNAPGAALLTVTLDLGSADHAHDWLDRQPACADNCYWSRPGEHLYRLGIGRAVVCTSAGPARFTALHAAHTGFAQHWRHDDGGTSFEPVSCLGFAFDDESADVLPNAQLGVAAILLDNTGGRLTASFTTPARQAHEAPARWHALLAAQAAAPTIAMCGTLPDSTLAMQAWSKRVEAALATIATGTLDKVVLSRTLRLALNSSGASVALLRRLTQHHATSTVYAMSNARGVFLGATPERLVGLANGKLRADALAGTAWDDQPLDAGKNLREQQLVVDAIHAALTPLCRTLDIPPRASILQLRNLRHLWTPVCGNVLPNVGLFDLIARMHPTPAVGGWPTAAARDWLRRNGEQRPGWYGGGIGWTDRRGDGEVAVALRSGMFTPGCVELTAGAGIVAGSRPDQEFGETEAKLGTMLDALRKHDNAGRQPRTGTA